MFKKSFSNDFQFSTNLFLDENKIKPVNFDYFIFVIYDKEDLIECLKLHKEGSNALVCVFKKQMYTDLLFLEEMNDLILLDGSKSKKDLIADLKRSLNCNLNYRQQAIDSRIKSSYIALPTEFYNSFRKLIISPVV